MEEEFSESSLNNELQSSRTVAEQDSVQDMEAEQGIQNQNNQSLQQDQGPDETICQDQEELNQGLPAPCEDQGPDQDYCDGGGASGESEHHPLIQVEEQDEMRRVDLKTDSPQDQDQINGAANQEPCVESGGGVPALVITQVEEALGPGSRVAPAEPVEPQRPQRPTDLLTPLTLLTSSTSQIPLTPTDPSPSSSSDGGDMSCSDLFSLRSDSISLASEPTVSRASEDDDCRSVAASSVMSLFQRMPLDPLEKDWLKSSAVGNLVAQRRLLTQDPSLVLKKDFVTTALHWAAKQGRQEVVDMMLRSGADVNARSGYTALHLASIHSHQHVVLTLINRYNAKTNLRDYHGKTALHYWSGSSDVFIQRDSQSGGRLNQGRPSQRYALPSLLLRSLSQGQLSLPQAASQDVLELHI